jgi:bifunctional enzyme CysN/CysC
MDASRPLNIVIAGHVDHGKSTLIGRLLHETGSLPPGKVDELIQISRRRGVAMEWSFILDALQAERDQAVTIDTTRIWFRANGRRYAIIDAPGHREFVRNMLSGASEADAAILVIDVAEGVGEQTRRHAYLLRMLGIRQVVVAVNKMDAVDYDHALFDDVAAAIAQHLATLGITPAAIVPISAREGDNLLTPSANLRWYAGRTILDVLEEFQPAGALLDAPFRMRVQDVYRIDGRRVIVGRIDAGRVCVGETLLVLPSRARAKVSAIVRWPQAGPSWAHAGESIGLTLDQPVFVDRGDMLSHQADAPAIASAFRATCFWLAAEPPAVGEALRLRMGPFEASVTVASIDRVIDTDTLQSLGAERIPQYAVVDLSLRGMTILALDTREENPLTARLVLLRGRDVAAGGVVTDVRRAGVAQNLHPHQHLVSREERAARNGHRGAVIWLTGLSGAGKSTLALAVERHLFTRGYFVYVLDGDNIRSGLNADLGFSAEDRAENIRRVGEVAALFADAGAVVITAFISPFARDRATARAAAGQAFHEVFVKADLQTCEARDPRGLYRRARAGQISEFTGISSPYEPPERPELVLDTAHQTIEACVEQLVRYILEATSVSAQEHVMT